MFLNKLLSEKLGWTNIVVASGALLGTPPDGATNSRGQAMVPNWSGDDAAAFQLMCSNCSKSPEEARSEIVQAAITLAYTDRN